MKSQTRNLRPISEAVAAMFLYGEEYAAQNGGSMDFWDGLSESRKQVCRDLVKRVIETIPNRDRK